ncbi:MAG: DUF1150 family protein [Pseudomonadota bacterium]
MTDTSNSNQDSLGGDDLTSAKAPISRSDFLMFGMDDVAYVKCVKDEHGARQFAIYAADGTEIVMMEHREAALAAIRHHEMEPVSLH